MREININEEYMDMRLDRFVLRMTTLSKGEIQKVLRKKVVKVNGKKQEGSYRLQKGDNVKFYLPDEKYKTAEKTSKNQVKRPENIVYEDDNIIILNKPKGILSQGNGSTVDNLVDILDSYVGKGSGGILTRLDRNTSGLVLGGKTRRGLMVLNELNRERKIDKRYLALVEGVFNKEGKIEYYGKKDQKNNKLLLFENDAEDLFLVSGIYKVIKKYKKHTLLEVKLITGKTHQIRAQLAKLGYPVVGDVKYGKKDSRLSSQFLHCYSLKIEKNDKYSDIIPKDISVKIDLSKELSDYVKFIEKNV